jgi:hypothetical protein
MQVVVVEEEAKKVQEQDRVVLVELEAAVLVALVRLHQAQPLDQMVLTVVAAEVAAQVVLPSLIKHLVAATAALA